MIDLSAINGWGWTWIALVFLNIISHCIPNGQPRKPYSAWKGLFDVVASVAIMYGAGFFDGFIK